MSNKTSEQLIQELKDALPFNHDDLDVNTPNGREKLLYRFLKSRKYSRTAIAVLMAQAKHESAHFKTLREYGKESYFAKYEPNTPIGKRLGNTQRGDGARYKGRGFVQLTGRFNYSNVSKDLGVDLINHPEIAENPFVALYIFEWFIKNGNKFKDGTNVAYHAEKGDIHKTTRLINGGYNGLEDRIKQYNDYLKRLPE